MNYRRLGRSGLRLSELSFGSWVTYGNQMDERVARECMAAAYDAGVNFFDNAEVYAKGNAETIMGDALKKLGWRRASYVVSTKFFWGLNDGPNEKNTLNRKYLMQAIDGSLARLRLDHVDLAFCHRPDPDTPIEETVFAFDDMIRAGKVLYWGTSEWSAAEIMAAYQIAERHHLHKPVMEQPQYNLLHRERVEHEYARLYRDIGLGTTTWSPLASGLLTGKYARGDQGLRMARRSHPRTDRTRQGPIARSDRRRARLYARADVPRVVPQESARVDGDHRREPARASRREHALARRRREAHARRHGAHRRRGGRLKVAIG
jgi:voltage-dependent potassium channel beta subunit